MHNIALAKDINCLCPRDNLEPPSPTFVSYFCSKVFMNSSALTAFAAAYTSSSVASSFPYLIFSLIVPLNKCGVCNT